MYSVLHSKLLRSIIHFHFKYTSKVRNSSTFVFVLLSLLSDPTAEIIKGTRLLKGQPDKIKRMHKCTRSTPRAEQQITSAGISHSSNSTVCTYTSQNKKIKYNRQFSSIKLFFHAVFRTSFHSKTNYILISLQRVHKG